MTCRCDVWTFPPPLAIVAGLDALPRQIASFPTLRHALLSQIPAQPALVTWRGRDAADLGVMLLEMWAYVGDVVAFYDQVIANEAYLRTAVQRSSLTGLTGLLGYRPTPAVGARVALGLVASGTGPFVVPRGTGFASIAFPDAAGVKQPPQTFEIEADATVDPRFDSFAIVPPPATSVAGGATVLLLDPATAGVSRGDLLAIVSEGITPIHATTATDVRSYTGANGASYVRVTLRDALPATVSLAHLDVRVPVRTATVASVSGSYAALDASYRQILPGDVVIAWSGSTAIAASAAPSDATTPQTVVTATDGSTTPPTSQTFSVPVTVTQLELSPAPPALAPGWCIGFALRTAGDVVGEPEHDVSPSDAPLHIVAPLDPGVPTPTRLLLADATGAGVAITGTVSLVDAAHLLTEVPTLVPDAGSAWSTPLLLPVTAYGNTVIATRGQTVPLETLGAGDASVASQAFALAKSPLTYLTADAGGLRSTLQVWVDGIQWQEVASFYGQVATAHVYIVRESDAQVSTVTFGDGARGSRLPTGAVVTASYRFGAGAATPPANGVCQLAAPIAAITAVVNPVAAGGGADAIGPDGLRTFAPRTALLLGRAVSIDDMQALALAQPGVRAAAAQWRWSPTQQRPVAQIWFVGDAGIDAAVAQAVRAWADPTTPIAVTAATANTVSLSIDVVVDPARHAEDVLPVVRAALIAPGTGLLSPEQLGVGQPVFRSRVLQAITAVPGIDAVRAILWNGAAFSPYGIAAPAGSWFSLADADLTVTAVEATS
jgi:hypothetical protein|nr:hypothetical protein [Kofleriaceae bacterium]